jgi:nitrogen regulatory protein PII
MKLISATIKPTKLDHLLEEIQQVNGVVGLTVIQAKGFEHISNLKESDLLEMKHYIKIELTVQDDAVENVHDTIVKVAHTGLSGDGQISVLPVDSTYRIATKKYL